ncbi:hypothetical protein GCM10023322_68520 [Rugosimonospora acidiphila]|uniref:Uncharacterized protein n=1 Tax=Rugosimonospora acidiphila TaxID=556531 RepID=A0ABP9SK68_9ACTN
MRKPLDVVLMRIVMGLSGPLIVMVVACELVARASGSFAGLRLPWTIARILAVIVVGLFGYALVLRSRRARRMRARKPPASGG